MIEQNISSIFSFIPYLKNLDNKYVKNNHNIIKLLLDTFFFSLSDYISLGKLYSTNYQQLSIEEIIE